ncbi:MAG: FeoB-associated Cys-rich membrane protein [Oscillospiraceae bacterium]|nr:FeoB-associated Cys-rich membrane protein [Oscillospiraceae bacterium]
MASIIASLGVQDYIALAVIAAAVVSAVVYLKKRGKSGCRGCCGGCSGCAFADKCQNKKENDNGTEDQLSDTTGENTENP